MAITRTAKGTAVFGATTTATISSVTLETGETLVLCIYAATGNRTITTVTWNGVALTLDASASVSSQRLWVYSLPNVTGATGNISVVLSGTCRGVIIASSLSSAALSPFDKTANASGTSTSPSSGATSTTVQADEILLGFVGNPNSQGGTWSNSFNAGQAASDNTTSASASEGFLVVAATGTYTAAKTGITSSTWLAMIVTYKGLLFVATVPYVLRQAVKRAAYY